MTENQRSDEAADAAAACGDGGAIPPTAGEVPPPERGASPGALRALLHPEVTARLRPEGYLDVLPETVETADTRSQSLWMSRRGPKVYLKLIQPVVRTLGAPPDAAALAPALRLGAGAKVLDVGCGPGIITAGLAGSVGRDGIAVGLDLSEPMLDRALQQAPVNMGLIRGDASRLPFGSAVFDAACSTAVVMLVPDPMHALSEMLRVVRPGGWLAVVVPCRGTGPVGRIGAAVGGVAGGRMFRPGEVAEMFDRLGADRVYGQSNGLISTTFARRAAD
ncbi:class I SAM-dependent methyltransferase [Streptomonospora wellingtoniae]|uniref:Methyltransferase domain-containing protein n=1 Tax=Streptomonospora wellingtoniae TaxID=3075544 RepID=A0ABU2KX94_9ACTN|nr:methyltransferase domain-containing protein [Streptomonospora sp. DSM 45055]MDT0303934.1 methyltransferase domain-containing protein [Streptomonospora sp. DSM 45055]